MRTLLLALVCVAGAASAADDAKLRAGVFEPARAAPDFALRGSDATELTLSRVGPLGTVKRRSLELVPGNYTLTGSRRGYRDVRRQFSVTPGAPGPSVTLRCKEAL